MLAFKRILNTEFPLRMLPLDYLETLQDEDGFDMIVSTNTSTPQNKSIKQSRSGRRATDQAAAQ